MKQLVIALLFVASPAYAQQQATPSQVALQINSVIAQWAQALEAQQKQIAELQKEVADLKAAQDKK